jgi:HSP20 family molecular chaperone IbpA
MQSFGAMVVPLVMALAAASPVAERRERTRPHRAAEEGAIPVYVRETPASVRLTIHLPEGVEPDSVDVQLADRTVIVVARDATGREIRSSALHLEEPATEEGTTAQQEGGGWITVTLPKVRHRRTP